MTWQRHGVVELATALAACLAIGACRADDLDQRDAAAHRIPLDAVQVLGRLEQVSRVTDMVPADNGEVWVLNAISPFFVVLGAGGQVVRAFGDEGGGPNEFGFPVRIVSGPGEEVWTYDVARHSLIRVSGERWLTYPLPSETLPRSALLSFANAALQQGPPWMAVTNGDFVFARPTSLGVPVGLPGLWDAELYRLRPDGGGDLTVGSLMSIGDLMGDPAAGAPAATTLGPYPLWTICEDGVLGLYDPIRNALRLVGATGDELESFELPNERKVELTADRLIGMAYRQIREDIPAGQRPDSAEFWQQMQGQFRQVQQRSAGIFPEYADLQCGTDGTLWLQPFDVETGFYGRGPHWLMFDENRKRTAVEFPTEFRALAFGAERVWGVMQDEMGVASVAWIGTEAIR